VLFFNLIEYVHSSDWLSRSGFYDVEGVWNGCDARLEGEVSFLKAQMFTHIFFVLFALLPSISL
jgi:hypothetical protein